MNEEKNSDARRIMWEKIDQFEKRHGRWPGVAERSSLFAEACKEIGYDYEEDQRQELERRKREGPADQII